MDRLQGKPSVRRQHRHLRRSSVGEEKSRCSGVIRLSELVATMRLPWRSKHNRTAQWLLVRNETRGTTLAQRADIADSAASRRKGLLGRQQLDKGEGLWIVPCQGVHCWGMQFAIDLVYLDSKRRVRKVRANVKPWGLSASLTSHSVLELPSGTIKQTGTQRGDQLALHIMNANPHRDSV